MTRFVYLAGVVLFWQASSLVAQAQLVQVRPGYVKAPFVRVYSYPDGSSHVRAPFVDVYSPGYRPMEPLVDVRPMGWRELAQAAREWTGRLNGDLDHFPSGAFWKSSLRMEEIPGLIASDSDDPPADAIRGQIRDILKTFDTVAGGKQVNAVVELASFQNLRAALAELSTPPVERLRRQTYWSADKLDRALDRFDTADHWRKFLGLSSGKALSGEQLQGPESPELLAVLAVVQNQFDKAAQNEEYRVITDLPAFQEAHNRLAAYLSAQQSSPMAPPEELPTPKPDRPASRGNAQER